MTELIGEAPSPAVEDWTHEGDWTEWRGPHRDGHASAFGTIDSWPKQPEVMWRRDAGTGQASPLVATDRVVVFDRLDESERLAAIRAHPAVVPGGTDRQARGRAAAQELELDQSELSDAIRATFHRRGTRLPEELPIALQLAPFIEPALTRAQQRENSS